jgi:hypothetical protein
VSLLPNRFLFKFEFPLHRAGRLKLDGNAAAWDRKYLLPPLYELDAEPPTGQVYAAWNDAGLYVACHVAKKRRPLHCDPAHFKQSDHLRLMLDMRDTRQIRRATRFCRQFYFLPTGGGRRQGEPVAGTAPIARATEDPPAIDASRIVVAAKLRDDGYGLTAHLPTAVLSGFDVEVNPRIGFMYMLEDNELGNQSLTVGDDLNWWCDPSTWPTAVLTD